MVNGFITLLDISRQAKQAPNDVADFGGSVVFRQSITGTTLFSGATDLSKLFIINQGNSPHPSNFNINGEGKANVFTVSQNPTHTLNPNKYYEIELTQAEDFRMFGEAAALDSNVIFELTGRDISTTNQQILFRNNANVLFSIGGTFSRFTTRVKGLAAIESDDFVIKSQLETLIATALANVSSLQGGFNASTSPNFPVASGSTKKGDYWYVTTAGTVQGITFNVGDTLIAIKANASTTLSTDWIFLESNRDQATTTTLGLVKLADVAEVRAGIVTDKAITPETLNQRTATEIITGLIGIATQSETDAGLNDSKAVTPLKLKNVLDNLSTGSFAMDIGDDSATTFVVNHNLLSLDVSVSIYRKATGAKVMVDYNVSTTNYVTVSFKNPPATNEFRVVVKK